MCESCNLASKGQKDYDDKLLTNCRICLETLDFENDNTVYQCSLCNAWVHSSCDTNCDLLASSPYICYFCRPENFDAVITLGCVIRGETPHFDFVAGPCADALMKIQCDYNAFNKLCPPIIFGVLTTDNREQAMARSGGDHSDKGRDCAEAAVEMANLIQSMGRSDQ